MNGRFALALAAGGLLGCGLLAAIVFALGSPPRTSPPWRPSVDMRALGVRLGVGLGVGVVVLVVTRWLVLAAALGLLAASWRKIFGGAAEERAGIRRLDALASWTESLRDTIAGAVGLEQAIPATTATAGPAIRPALNLLVDRLRTRDPLPTALLRFAEDMADPSADLIVSSLVLNARLRGPGLRDVLGALATSAREELDMRRRVESSRRSTRRSVQIVIAVTLGVAGMLILLNRTYVKPYGTVVGQLVLLVVILLFAGGILWLRRLARIEMPARFLTSDSSDGPVDTDVRSRPVHYAAVPVTPAPSSWAGGSSAAAPSATAPAAAAAASTGESSRGGQTSPTPTGGSGESASSASSASLGGSGGSGDGVRR